MQNLSLLLLCNRSYYTVNLEIFIEKQNHLPILQTLFVVYHPRISVKDPEETRRLQDDKADY